VIGWSHKRGPAVIAADDQQSRRDVGSVLTPEEVHISLEDRPQAYARPEPAVIEQQRRACDPVGADDALVAVNRQQHALSASLQRRYRNDPLLTELLTKKSFFYRARRSYCECACQRVRSFGEFGIDGRDVQDCHQSSIDPEYGRAGAAQTNVSGPKMLTSVNSYRPLFDDAGTDAVCTLTSSDHTPPSQVPQYSNWLARASSPRWATATPELSQNKTTYLASQTTLYN
jgi:hypothetical protein